MLNPYSIIVALFVITGLLVTAWGVIIIIKARETQQWPNVAGVIVESNFDVGNIDLLPHIAYSYIVEGQSYHRRMEFSADISPTQEFATSYVEKYPLGTEVQVYYHPDNPQRATLEPGLGKGDWLVVAIGLSTLLFGILFLFF
ncbi:DUF3592 domain-containing protein [Kaarinaea lacus]